MILMEIGIQINLVALGNWHGNWTWSLPLIVGSKIFSPRLSVASGIL